MLSKMTNFNCKSREMISEFSNVKISPTVSFEPNSTTHKLNMEYDEQNSLSTYAVDNQDKNVSKFIIGPTGEFSSAKCKRFSIMQEHLKLFNRKNTLNMERINDNQYEQSCSKNNSVYNNTVIDENDEEIKNSCSRSLFELIPPRGNFDETWNDLWRGCCVRKNHRPTNSAIIDGQIQLEYKRIKSAMEATKKDANLLSLLRFSLADGFKEAQFFHCLQKYIDQKIPINCISDLVLQDLENLNKVEEMILDLLPHLQLIVIDGADIINTYGEGFTLAPINFCVDFFKKIGCNKIMVFMPLFPIGPSNLIEYWISRELQQKAKMNWSPYHIRKGKISLSEHVRSFMLRMVRNESCYLISNEDYSDIYRDFRILKLIPYKF